MTVSITHAKVSGKAAGNDPTRVYGTHWDEDHVVPIATNEEAQAGVSEDVLLTPAGATSLVGALVGNYAVRYDQAQSLSTGAKTQARENIDVDGAISGAAVRYDAAQTLTDEQKEQARENIDIPITWVSNESLQFTRFDLDLPNSNTYQLMINNSSNILGGFSTVGAVNERGFPSFRAHTKASDLVGPFSPGEYVASTAGVYSIAINDYSGTANVVAFGAYLECQVSAPNRMGIGAEIDVQNTSGLDPRTITPNNMFGTSGPLPVGAWIACGGTAVPFGAYDVSAAIGIPSSSLESPARFYKGIVFGKDSIKQLSGHYEAVGLGALHEFVWYDATNDSIVNRLYSDGTNATFATQNLFQLAANSTAASFSIGYGATGDRASRLYFGASSTGGNTDATILRAAGANGSLQIIQQGTGVIALVTNGSNAFLASSTQQITLPGYAAGGVVGANASGVLQLRSIAAGTGATVTNGNGVSGNPTISTKAVVQTVSTANATTASTSHTGTGVSASITPSSTSARIRVTVTGYVGADAAGILTNLTLFRGVTELTPASTTGLAINRCNATATADAFCIDFIDSPAASTSTTYELYWKVGSGNAFLGRRGADTTIDAPTTITLQEVT